MPVILLLGEVLLTSPPIKVFGVAVQIYVVPFGITLGADAEGLILKVPPVQIALPVNDEITGYGLTVIVIVSISGSQVVFAAFNRTV